VVAIVRAQDEAHAIRLVNDTDYGLPAAVFTKDTARGLRVARQVKSSMCHINGPMSGSAKEFLMISQTRLINYAAATHPPDRPIQRAWRRTEPVKFFPHNETVKRSFAPSTISPR
jgi:hypothetical protein